MSTASRMPRHGNYQDMVLHELKVSDLTWDMLTGFSGPSRTAIHGNHMVFFPCQAFLRDAGLVDPLMADRGLYHLDLAFIRGGGSSGQSGGGIAVSAIAINQACITQEGLQGEEHHVVTMDRRQIRHFQLMQDHVLIIAVSGAIRLAVDMSAGRLEVLYGTNTIHIDTRILLLGLHEILSPEKLRLMKDLEINVSGILDVASYFKGSPTKLLLKTYQFCFHLTPVAVNCRRDGIHSQEEVDKLVQRILLPGTEVIVSAMMYSDLLSFIHSRWLSPIATRA
ncbi:unnamed protein product [Clonostachys rosea f. rosea IK726]|uniref:Uncharacterized protein n=1 Tax=Clonostachys rosea f. rosea IK726 TaxID=1349383 RepID=A0ACA9UV06_BIOOC|nr:unnamed protein product [Clonostachys rosea f. rosea IK726]